MNLSARHFQNAILASLSPAARSRITPHLTPVTLEQEQTLSEGHATHGYFLEEGIASVVVTLQTEDTVEVGIIGMDGVVGFPILLGTDSVPGRTFIQIAGSGFRIPAATLKEEFDKEGEFRVRVQKYMQGFMVQSAQTAACNRMHNIQQRLARWLLSCQDRQPTNELRLTQDFLGQMLGAPRTTVTIAAGMLQRAGMIEYSRGIVKIIDRSALEAAACECYRVVRNEFQRLSLLYV